MPGKELIPIGRLLASEQEEESNTAYLLLQKIGGYSGTRTLYRQSVERVEVYVPEVWPNAARAALRTLNTDDAETHPATIVVDGSPRDAVEVRGSASRALATKIDGGWMLVVTMPPGGTVPEVRLFPGEKTSADGAVHFTLPPGVAESLRGEQD
ncbi:hypothetical protein KGQ19_22525 [Catenulispora sp. NL8]|uniref:Uncharacterized protein n=1 Tax=Catenulispora pinistramenti TaxID=2705254 RepID=A0ABS5KUB6_9ACTN|nr:hypothetical protein [Catenulispora pinistramenti]MBS2549643.1 hypothetical protein [Catenulispora pinistramenti]